MSKKVANDLAAALETGLRAVEVHASAQDVVLIVRRDGRAEIDFVTEPRSWCGPTRRFFREPNGTWMEHGDSESPEGGTTL